MRRYATDFSVLFTLFLGSLASAQNPPASDPQALAYAAQSIAALTGGASIKDVTLTGKVVWNGGVDSGTAKLMALGSSESRMDLALSAGMRSEIRDAQTGVQLGEWINPNNTSGQFAYQNCWTDAPWFFPALGSLVVGPNVVISYIGQATWNGSTVQHIQSYVYQAVQVPTPGPQQFSAMDFYLDATSLLPVAITYNAHPDNNAGANLLVEVDFSNYQSINGAKVPTRIQRLLQGNLLIDLTVSGVAFNTGLPFSDFTIN